MAIPTVPPVLTPWAQRAYDRLAPWAYADPQNGWPLAYLIASLSELWADVATVTETDADGTPGLARTMNPLTAPVWALPMLAARAGVTLTAGMTESQQRLAINGLDAASRGKPSVVIAAAQFDPVGGTPRRVKLAEGNGTVDITVYQSETPSTLLPLIRARLEQQVPFELKWTLNVAPGWSWDEMAAHYTGQTWAAMTTDNTTWASLVERLP